MVQQSPSAIFKREKTHAVLVGKPPSDAVQHNPLEAQQEGTHNGCLHEKKGHNNHFSANKTSVLYIFLFKLRLK